MGRLERIVPFYFNMDLCDIDHARYARGENILQLISWQTIHQQSALKIHINVIVEQILSYLVFIQDINKAHRDIALGSRSIPLFRKSLTVSSAFLRSQQSNEISSA